MKYPAYPKYKESGVEWLGEVPEDWDVRPIKFLVSIPVTDGPHETPEIFNEGIPFVSAEAIKNGIINFDKIRGHISDEDHKRYSDKYRPKKGDIYMVKSGATTGRIAMVETDIEFNIWSPLAAIRCNPQMANRHFVYHYLHSKEFQTAVELSWSFGTQQNIGMGVIQNLAVPLPTLPEQTAIADYLDQATGKIDTLVAKNRALIGLLKEKRTALISRTVTRGLPAEVAREYGLEPHTRFKDSGIEWLGEIAECWDTCPVKFLVSVSVTDGPHETPEILNEGIPFVSAEAIKNGIINFDKIRGHISEDDHKRYSKKYKPKKGDIYMVKSGATTGRIAMVETDIEFNIWSPLAAIRCNPLMANRHFVYHYLHSKEFQTAVELSWSFGTQQNIGMGVIQNLAVPLPTLPEQNAIATYLDRETAQIDKLIEKVEAAIARLQEYRTALITAAVTGKIDIREAIA